MAENIILEPFEFHRPENIQSVEEDAARRKQRGNLEVLRGLLLWLYDLGIHTTGPDSGKPGWPTEVVRTYSTGRPSCCIEDIQAHGGNRHGR